MSDRHHLFTSECVSMGHPDKVADQISDAVVDAYLAQDPNARVALETLVTTNLVVLAGEVKAAPGVDVVYEKLARRTIADIGYDDPELLFDAAGCNIHLHVHAQSPDISMGVDRGDAVLGAGDQGLMFGYACDDTPERMPLPITLARRIIDQLVKARQSRELPWLRPDAKSQVTVEFDGVRAVRVHTVVVSTQHHPSATQAQIREAVIEKIVKPVMPATRRHWVSRASHSSQTRRLPGSTASGKPVAHSSAGRSSGGRPSAFRSSANSSPPSPRSRFLIRSAQARARSRRFLARATPH